MSTEVWNSQKEARVVPGILSKIAIIQEAVGTIPKNGRGPAAKGGFEFVRFDDVVQAIRDLFIANSVVSSLRVLDYQVRPEQVGNRMVVNSSVLVEYTYTDTTDGSTHVTMSAGEGSDIGGDTATRKAFSQAWKIALLQTFNIVTGEEPDTDGDEAKELPSADGKPAAKAASKMSLTDLKIEIGKYIKRADNPDAPYTAEEVNTIGDRLAGTTPQTRKWKVSDHEALLKALKNGEVA